MVTHLGARKNRHIAGLPLQRAKNRFAFQLDLIRAAHEEQDGVTDKSHIQTGVKIQRGHNVYDEIRLESRGWDENGAVWLVETGQCFDVVVGQVQRTEQLDEELFCRYRRKQRDDRDNARYFS